MHTQLVHVRRYIPAPGIDRQRNLFHAEDSGGKDGDSPCTEFATRLQSLPRGRDLDAHATDIKLGGYMLEVSNNP